MLFGIIDEQSSPDRTRGKKNFFKRYGIIQQLYNRLNKKDPSN
jgi:hypothetical protein